MEHIKPKKRLGQNFLIDQSVVELIVETADLKKEDIVIEPGCGTGVVTEMLVDSGAQIIGVEIDTDLIQGLTRTFKNDSNFTLENKSVLELDFTALTNSQNYKVVGSIPYQISSPLIHKFLFEKVNPSLVCIVVQKEVAEKIVGGQNKGSYMSNIVSLFYNAKVIQVIKPKAFNPPPKVDSAILLLTLKPDRINVDIKKFKGFLHKAFANRRKMLNKTFSTEKLDLAGISHSARPQELGLETLLKLYTIDNV